MNNTGLELWGSSQPFLSSLPDTLDAFYSDEKGTVISLSRLQIVEAVMD